MKKTVVVIMGSLIVFALVAIGVNSLLNPKFSRTLDPRELEQRSGVVIPANAHILDAGTIDTYGVYPIHEMFAVFTIDKTQLSTFLKQPGCKVYNPSNARIGKEITAGAPKSLNFDSTQWNAANVKHFQVYHYSEQAGDILVDLDAPQFAKIYIIKFS